MSKPRILAAAAGLLAAAAAHAQTDSGDQATIIRDNFGVPHIYGNRERALYYAHGYAQSQDRLWQAEVFRRLATGTMAEILGPSRLEADIQARALFGPATHRAALFAAAPAQTREVFEAFADGLNAGIDAAVASNSLPIEFLVNQIVPRPWTADDVVAITLLIGFNFGSEGYTEATCAAEFADYATRLGPAAGAAVFADTHWLDDPSATPTVPPATDALPARVRPAAPPALPAGAAGAGAQFRQRQAALDAAFEHYGLKGPHSNAIVVGPRLSADGRALLMGGPQTGYTLPQFFHEVGLHGDGVEVTGVGLPGVPGAVVGVGRDHSWTITTGYTDTCDTFIEVLNPANPGQYLFNGQWRDAEVRPEVFQILGQSQPHVEIMMRTVHGPVVGAAGGFAYSMRIAGEERALDQSAGLLEFARVREFAEFQGVASTLPYNFNVLYADNRGNIAYFHTGRVPVRAAGANPWFPQMGDGTSEWQGFVPWAQMPGSVNPAQGYLVNWNNKPAAGWANTTRGFGDWGPVQRVNTLAGMLEQLQPGTVTVATLMDMNRRAGRTTGSPSGAAAPQPVSTLRAPMLAAVNPGADPRLPAVLSLVQDWDGQEIDADSDGKYDQPQVAIFNTWYAELTRACEDELGAFWDRHIVANLVGRTLAGNSAALPLLHDYLGGQSTQQWVTGSLVAAIGQLTALYNSPQPASWLQPVVYTVYEPIGAGTVPPIPYMNRGTYNQFVHLGRGENLWGANVLAPGQSGDPFSPHFADQLLMYATWQYKPMLLRREMLEGRTESVLRLRVP